MKKTLLLAALLLFTSGSIAPAQAAEMVPPQDATPAAQPAADDQIVATVNDQPIKTSELDAHVAVTGLSREEALEDLIDLQLLRAAVTANKISVPARAWSQEERAGIEYALTQALGLYVPPRQVTFVLDHAWLKDAEDEKERSAGRVQLERLRALVVAGATIPDAYNQLQVDGTLWHIGDHEEYIKEVLPAEAADFTPGTLSQIIPGDGGLHLFKIYQRKESLPPSDDIRVPLLTRLRLDASIDRPEAPNQ